MDIRFVRNITTIAVVSTTVFFLLVFTGSYLWFFTAFRMCSGILKVPSIKVDTTYFDTTTNETHILLDSDLPFEKFDGASYLRLLGRSTADSLPYTKYFEGNTLNDDVVLDCSDIVRLKIAGRKFVYTAIIPGALSRDTIYARIFFVRAYGYSYGSNLVEIRK